MARAEEALAEARRRPSDGYVVYRPSPQRSSERALNARSATETVRCLREGLFRLAFQPVIAAKTRTPVFHEALLRMVDSAGEVITAVHLIPIAEKLGLVRLIDRAVAQMVVASLHKYPDARLSLNLSGTTATDPRWYPQIIEMLASNRAVTDRLTIEITETVALGDLHETVRFVEQLRELGCRVAIDDFGAGFTSFRNLRTLPIDMLKLDGTFCRDLAGNGDNTYFVRSLIDMARTFGIQTVAEWVESEEDAVLLRDWGIDLMQGNLFGEAMLQAPWPAAKEAAAAGARSPFVLPSEIEWDNTLAETPVLREEDLASLPAEPAEPAAPWNPASEPAPSATESETLADTPKDGATETVVQSFEHGLSGELGKLRDAISALDLALKGHKPAKAAEPSFADLVSDTARRAAG
jgi:EAL domain-containing protein (putative c-di-GMP-specific phosphodiesterase class I)